MKSLRVNADRLKQDFDKLAEIGSTGDGGVHRPALSEAHLAARTWFRERVQAAGLELKVDPAGNHSARLDCGPPGAAFLLLGSHLDSVPFGGRFDGALGVVSALEVLRTIQEAGLALPTHLEAIDFTDEEGTLVGLLGSAALAGQLHAEDLESPRGGRQTLLDGLHRAGLSEAGLFTARREPNSLAGYLELHIEQGPRLLEAGANIASVTAIVGIGSYSLAFLGRADHAGTTPLPVRQDAGLGACAFALEVHQLILADFPACVANIGALNFAPGAFNIIPARASLALEFRSGDQATFDRLEAALLEKAQSVAQKYGLGLEIELRGKHPPEPMSATNQQAIAQAVDDLGLRCIPLASGAGHDAQMLASLCPAGMIFIPSVGGASHSAREFSQWQDCVNGANVLLQAAIYMAFGEPE